MGNCIKSTSNQFSYFREFDEEDIDEFVDQAQTGDIILFDNTGIEYFWKCFTRSTINHVGVVVELKHERRLGTGHSDPQKDNMKLRPGKYLLEAIYPEVDLINLKEVSKYYLNADGDGDKSIKFMAWRPLIPTGGRPQQGDPGYAEYLKEKAFVIEDKAIEFEGTQYENDMKEIVMAVLQQDSERLWCGCCCAKKVSENAEDMDEDEKALREKHRKALFCSETCADILEEAGWVSKALDGDRYLPKDFMDGRNSLFEQRPDLLVDCSFGEPVKVVLPGMKKLQSPAPSSSSASDKEQLIQKDTTDYGASGTTPRKMKVHEAPARDVSPDKRAMLKAADKEISARKKKTGTSAATVEF